MSSLTNEQISRLSGYVNGMLGVLDTVEKVDTVEDVVVNQSPEQGAPRKYYVQGGGT